MGSTGTFSFTGDNGFQGDSITTVSSNVPVSGRSLSLAQSGIATTLTEAAPPAGWALSDVSCTGLGSGGTATPNTAARSVLLDALATAGQNNISCTFTNVKLPRLRVQKQLPGGRFAAADQFTLTVNGPAATTHSVTTTGSGTTASGIATLNSGIGSYTVAETASGSTNLSNYTSSYSCVNATPGGTAVPTGTGNSFSTPLAANDDVLCTLSNATFPVLGLTKTTGASPMQVGVAQDYLLTVLNTGGGASPASFQVLDRLPAHLQFNSASGASCVPSGSTASGQLLTCTVSGPLAAAGSTTFRVNATPLLATAGTSVTNRASVDPSGGTPGDPLACVSPKNPAGCATVTTPVAAQPSLALTKSSPAVFVVGTAANYTLTITNSGGAATPASVVVQEHLPANMQFNSVAGASCVASGTVATGQLLACSVAGPIPVGGSASFNVNVTPLAAVASTTVTNRAQVDPQGGVPGNPDLCTATGVPAGCATVNTPVDGVPHLGLAKASATSFVVGVPSPYTLTVSNNGSAASPSSFYVYDTLPANVQFNGASGASCTASGSVASGLGLRCQVVGVVAVGGSVSFTVGATALLPTAGTLLTNRASVDPGGNFPPIDPSTCTATGTPDGCATVTTPVNAVPMLALAKSGPANLLVGTAANYTLIVSNTGGAASPAGVVVQDLLPANVQFNSASGASCTASASIATGQFLACSVATPIAAGGSASVTVNVTALAATANTTVTNRATVDAQGGTPGNPADCSATGIPTGCATVNTPVNGLPLLDLAKTGPSQWVVGTPGNYTLTVRNTGSAASPARFYVRDLLPANLQFNSAAGAACTATGAVATGVDLQCLLTGPVAVGGSISFTVNVTALAPTAGTVLTNRAAVDPGGNFPPPDPSTCSTTGTPAGCATVTTPVDAIAVLSLAKTSPPSFTVGAAADYTLTLSNSGGAASPVGVQVLDRLPANVQFNSASGAACVAGGSLATGQTLACTLGASIPAGGSASFTVNVTAQVATANSVVTNRATVGVQGGVPNDPSLCTATGIAPGCATVNTPVGGVAVLGLVKTGPASFSVGTPANYTLTVRNTGTAASPVSFYVRDTLPANLQFNSASGASCSASATVAAGLDLLCNLSGPVAPGASASFTVNVTALAATAGTVLTNRAAVDPGGNFPPPDPATCASTGTPGGCATTSTPVDAIPVLDLLKTSPASFSVGVPVNYTLTVRNTGSAPSPASVLVFDRLPANLHFNSASGAACTASGTDAAGIFLGCSVSGPVPAGAGASFTVNVTALAPAAATTVSNRASVDPRGGTPVDPAACTATGLPLGCATVNTPVGGIPVLDLAKTGPASFTVGTPANYTLAVRNTGSASSPASFYVRDRLPANLQYHSASGASCVATGNVASGVELLCLVNGPVAVGSSKVFTVHVTALQPLAGTSVLNRAAVDVGGNYPPPDPVTCTATGTPAGCATTSTPVNATPVLVLAKTGPAAVAIGVAADYTLTLTNTGGAATAASVTVLDRLPANVQFNSAAGAVCVASGAVASGPLVNCTVSGPVAAGGGTASFTVNVTALAPTAATTVTNRATVDPNGGTPVDPGICTATGLPLGCATANTPVGGIPVLVLAKTGPAGLTVGAPGDYRLTVTNTGTASSPAVFYVRDRLPANVQFNAATGASCAASGSLATGLDLLCQASGPLAAGGGTRSFTVKVTPAQATAGTVLTNRAAVDPGGNYPPPDPGTCTANGLPAGCATTTTPVAAMAVLALAKAGPARLEVGVPSSYTLVLTNSGNAASPATVTVFDRMPVHLQFNAATGASCSAGGSVSTGQLLVCNVVGPIAAGNNAGFTVAVTALAPTAQTQLTNRASVAPQGGTPVDPLACTATGVPAGCAVAVVPVGSVPQLAVSKSVGVPLPLSTTAFEVSYAVLVGNLAAGAPAYNVQANESFLRLFPTASAVGVKSASYGVVAQGGAVCSMNPSFNGTTDTRLLAGVDTLAGGQSCLVRFVVSVAYASAAAVPNQPQLNSVPVSSVSLGAGPNPGYSNGGVTTPPANAVTTGLSVVSNPPAAGSPPGTTANVPTLPPAPTPVGVPTPVNLVSAPGSIAGSVWDDSGTATGGNRQRDPTETGLAGWTVEAVDANGMVVKKIDQSPATATTGANGEYQLGGLYPGDYGVRFRAPGNGGAAGAVFGTPVNGEQGNPQTHSSLDATTRLLRATVVAGETLAQQSLPLEPNGVVYDAMTRQPVVGATVTLLGPDGNPVPAASLLPDQQGQVTGPTGIYRFDLAATAASGAYGLRITPPGGYLAPSAILPAQTTLLAQQSGLVYTVVPSATAPQGSAATTHYLQLSLSPSSALVVHNHLPLDPATGGVLVVQKQADRAVAEVGDSVLYRIRVRNSGTGVVLGVRLVDSLPLGFKLIPGTVTLAAGHAVATVQPNPDGTPGPRLTYAIGNVLPGQTLELGYRARIGVGGDRGDGTNRARATDQTGTITSNEGKATVRVSGGVFTTEACVIGKVYVDCNGNRVQDDGEPGIPGVRLYFENGTNLTSDENGQYSICGLRPITHVLKVDPQSMPVGSRLETLSNRNAGDAESLFVDLKNGELHRADFAERSCLPKILQQVEDRRKRGPIYVPEIQTGADKTGVQFDSRIHRLERPACDASQTPACTSSQKGGVQ
ncbi:hypothetical protein [Rhodoferax sp. WC2427]|uniref:prealbumin-like fold domain-containing protein n=1 Tax=Rhodoferax sp. WC2427 TaxID=3234144 RepID=UPI003465AED3